MTERSRTIQAWWTTAKDISKKARRMDEATAAAALLVQN
jgi:hypothetical protein